MHTTMLPEAVLQERQAMLEKGLSHLQQRGYVALRAQDTPGYGDPDEVLVRVLNIHARPDITAEDPDHHTPTLAVVEVSSDLGEESCGRRWQALSRWAGDHAGQLVIFVHPEDRPRAAAIAAHWHVPADCLVSLAGHGGHTRH